MKKTYFLVCLLGIVLCAGFTYGEGRYQLVACGNQLFRIDTQTGTVWRYATMQEMEQRQNLFIEGVKQKIFEDKDKIKKIGIKFVEASSWSGALIEVLEWDEKLPIK